jgi:hypothetical protein
MLVEIYIFWQLIVLIIFFMAFFSRQEILWVIAMVLSAVMAFGGALVEYNYYLFNATSGAYDFKTNIYQYPYLGALNWMFFSLALIFGIYDIFDKYGGRFAKEHEQDDYKPKGNV